MDGGNCSSSYCLQDFNDFQIVGQKTSDNGCNMPANCLNDSENPLSADKSFLGPNLNQAEYIGVTNGIYPRSPRSSLDKGCVPPSDIIVQTSKSSPMGPRFHRVESDLDNGWQNTSDEEHAGLAVRDHNENHIEYFPTSDNPQSILVSLSIACPQRGVVCKQSQLFRIKFYGNFDKPLGRYFREDLFNQVQHFSSFYSFFLKKTFYYLINLYGLRWQISCCESCKEPAESHVRCYTHRQGSLTISVRNLASVRLPGENDGKIWMWHRCLRCKPKDGIPPATQRVVMSDAARGLSFGKFLELSFSNHTTANRVASCGHSLQRDCLRFYGYVIISCGKIESRPM